MRLGVWVGAGIVVALAGCRGNGASGPAELGAASGDKIVVELGAQDGQPGMGAEVPVQSVAPKKSKRVACGLALGRYHSCACAPDGSLWCWGENNNGQLGDGTQVDQHTPVAVTGIDGFVVQVAIAVGGGQSCARTDKGVVWCWVNRQPPTEVTTLGTSVAEIAISVEGTAAYARMRDGSLWAWAWSRVGRHGYGIPTPDMKQVESLGTSVAGIALGVDHRCARSAGGLLWCWGENNVGQLGDGTHKRSRKPLQVEALGSSVAQIALGRWHSCARKQDGSLWCWGGSAYGQLGDGTTNNRDRPVKVAALGASVAAVALGSSHSCARKRDGSLWCWGDNGNGQLGDGSRLHRHVPVQVAELGHEVTDFALGTFHTCASTQDGALWCWGLNSDGQLGDGTTTNRHAPVEVRL